MLEGKKIGFIGGGAIAEAIVRGMLEAKLVTAEQVFVYDISQERLQYLAQQLHVQKAADVDIVAQECAVVFLTVKPQVIDRVLTSLAGCITPAHLVISVAAGIPLNTLEGALPNVPVIRVMPNTPVAVSEGMSVLALGKTVTAAQADIGLAVFKAVGRALIMEESALDAVTGLSGSGPGYAFVLIDALADAGVRAGLTRQHSIQLAAQTLLGAAKMVLTTGDHPAKLRDMVTSPGGTTIAGIHELEKHGVRAALSEAVAAATARSKEMGKK